MLYHTPDDLDRALKAMHELEGLWDTTFTPSEEGTAPTDFSNRSIAVEFKQRSFWWGRFPDVILSTAKVLEIVKLPQPHTLFVIRTRDKILRWVDLRKVSVDTCAVRRGGRTHNIRRTKDYQEMVFQIPAAWFCRADEARPGA